ncbi:helix-turn-helix domain-containing protein [Roseimaritima sediminicola]|uniref:helix-turn-helix domain-containing protein n=1 Tax=Roseimaritima sediminicola TaxID=2662066 RepID=UPI00129825FB|nr:helix-turn-helix domain-containing protein [Roseimaritima sediminicola]
MATNYLPLDDAAQRLGVSHERLVELRSQGAIRGFRDGASWKFPESEIERVAEEIAAGELDAGDSDVGVAGGDDAGPGDSGLVSEPEVGSAIRSGKSSVIGGDDRGSDDLSLAPEDGEDDSDVGLGDEPVGSEGSDVNLVAREGGVEVVSQDSDNLSLADSGELTLAPEGEDSGMLDLGGEPKEGSTNPTLPPAAEAGAEPSSKIQSDLSLEADPMEGHTSSLEMLGDDLELSTSNSDSLSGTGASHGQDVLSELDLLASSGSGDAGDLIQGDSDPSLMGGGSDLGQGGSDLGQGGSGLELDDALDDDDDLVIADDDDDDLVLGGAGSDISIAGDSGINLMSPSDSGLSLESEPLDLAGSSISALDLGAEIEGSGSSAPGGPGSGASGSGSLVDFQADEDFQLSPSGIDIEVEEDSNSQVIEVEDSNAFGSGIDLAGVGVSPGEGGLGGDPFGDEVVAEGVVAGEGIPEDQVAVDPMAAPQTEPVALRPTYEVPYSTLSVISLLGILLVMSLGGMLVTDLMRNLWSYNELSSPVSSLTDALIGMFGLGP